MTLDGEILDLVERWEDARKAGSPITLDALCAGRPDLRFDVEKKIEALKAMAWLSLSGEKATNPHPLPLQPNQHLGRYRLDNLIARGGYGEVWKAHDPDLERSVAIKVPRADRRSEPLFIERFFEEARKVARLKHPRIVPVYDVGREGDWCYIVSDFIAGDNLASHADCHQFSHREAAILVAEIADALNYAHAEGFVHRDVKPHNILIDNDGHPHLTDFGIALLEGQSVQERSATAGTLPYMSPEQAEGRMDKINARSDIYALGVVLYELLARRKPFIADNPMDLWASIVSSSPRPLRTLDSSIPVELERICLKALAKQQEDRFSTAGDFAEALRIATATPRRRRWRWLATSVSLLLAFGATLFWQNYRSAWQQVQRETGNSQAIAAQVLSSKAMGSSEPPVEVPSIATNPSKTNLNFAELLLVGKNAVNSGRHQDAVHAYTQIIDNDPTVSQAWHGRGSAYFNQGVFDQAERDFRRAVELSPNNAEYRQHLAYALVRLGREDEAVSEILDGLKGIPSQQASAYRREVARIYKARAAKWQKSDLHDEALVDLKLAAEHAPDSADILHDLGSAYYNVGDHDAAVRILNKAIQIDPTKADFYEHRGHALKKLGREAEARSDYEAARNLKSDK